MTEFLERAEQWIGTWHGIAAPNEPARQMTEDLVGVIAAFEALRGQLRFEDEPASFEAALRAHRDEGTL